MAEARSVSAAVHSPVARRTRRLRRAGGSGQPRADNDGRGPDGDLQAVPGRLQGPEPHEPASVDTIRKVRRLVPQATVVAVSAHDYDRGAKPVTPGTTRSPSSAPERPRGRRLSIIGSALHGVELSDEQADAVGLLALVAGQDVEPGDEEGSWRIAQRVAPDRVISTVDPEARHMHKSRSEYRDGYKAHVAVEPETGLITAATLTPANAADGPTGVELLAGEAPGLQVLADSAYGSGEVRADMRAARHRQAIKPIPLRPAVPGGFDRDDFVIDHHARTATCPGGHTVPIAPKGGATFGVRCRGCPLRDRCTNAKDGRILHIERHDAELVEARRAWRDGDVVEDYRRWRPMVERSISWLVFGGHRRVRYRGVRRNQLGLSLRVAAVNLRRLVNLGLDRHDGSWALAT